jgi:serine/threonine protein phosphatase PrpC
MRFSKRPKPAERKHLADSNHPSILGGVIIGVNSTGNESISTDAVKQDTASERKQIWPGLLESDDKIRIPIKAKEKIGYSSEEIQSFPDMFLDELNIEEGKAIIASIRGDLKRHQGFLRQDSAIIESISLGVGTKYVLLIVADGVGSKRNSHLASRAAVIAASDKFRSLSSIRTDNWPSVAKEIFYEAVSAIDAIALEKNLRSEDLLTTLTIAALELTQTSERLLYVASVGNCRVLKIEDSKVEDLNSEIDLDALASTKTKALPLNVEEISVKVEKIGYDAIFCVLSDGAVEVCNQGLDFVSLLKSDDLESHKLAWALDVRSAGRVDDRTLAMWRPW